MKVYVDIVISGDTFDIVHTIHKPQDQSSALDTLHKIEEVIKRGLKYRSDFPDQYTELPQGEVLKRLFRAAQEIGKNYKDKTESLFFKKLRGIDKKQNEIKRVVQNIENITCPSPLVALPNELIHTIGLLGGVEVTKAIEQLCLLGNDNAKRILILQARELGFKGSDNYEAKKYIRLLLSQLKSLVRKGAIPKEYVVYKKSGHIYLEETLKKLKFFDTKKIFTLFSKEYIYSPGVKEFRELLINNFSEIEPTKSDENGVAALTLAANRKEESIIELLLKQGANFDGVETRSVNNEYSFIHLMSQYAYTKCLKLILEKKKYSPTDLNKALLLAIQSHSDITKSKEEIYATVKLLLENGADPNIPASNGSPPLHWAAQQGFFDIVALLLEYKALIKAPGNQGNTALCFAIIRSYEKRSKKDCFETVKVLLENGANPNIPAHNGSPPLHWAAQQGLADVVAILLKHGARINDLGVDRKTALCFALDSIVKKSQKECYETVKILLESGADPSIPSAGALPLQFANELGNEDVIALLTSDSHSK